MNQRDPWYIRLALALGYKPGSKEWSQTRNTSKHARNKTKPRNLKAKQKTRRKMAEASRKINRRK